MITNLSNNIEKDHVFSVPRYQILCQITSSKSLQHGLYDYENIKYIKYKNTQGFVPIAEEQFHQHLIYYYRTLYSPFTSYARLSAYFSTHWYQSKARC